MSQIKRPIRPQKSSNSRKIWIPIVVILLLAAVGGGYYYWTNKTVSTAQAATPTYKTAQVRRGSISLSASGSGTLVANTENQLTFSTSGTVAKVNVQVGDQVKKGQALAQLDNLDQLQAAVNSAQQDLISAQQALETFKQGAPANLANAQLAVSTAQKAVDTAQAGVIPPGAARCDQATTDAYYNNYMLQQKRLTDLGDGGGNSNYYLTVIVPQKNLVAQAYAAYKYCAGFNDYEIQASQANLALAKAQLQQAQDNLTLLTKNNGLNPTDLATNENKVANAQVALDQAKATLAGATITAPYDGTIIAIAGQPGDSVNANGTTSGSSGGFITIADLAHPQVQFSADEADLDKLAVGESAQVVFDALPTQTFTGKVVRINPALVTQSGSTVVQGLIQLDVSHETSLPVLAQGLTATVTLINAQADNVLLVPIQAVRDLGDGTSAVFVLDQSGQPRLRVVQVGLEDAASAEIKQGLKLGDVVTTGIAQTK
jgi:RND family efflux transporter MFP subunit